MSRTGEVTMSSEHAKMIEDLGTNLHGGPDRLGFPQAAFVVLTAIASGEYRLVKQTKKKRQEDEE